MHRPPEVLPARLGDHVGGVRAVHRDVMFETVVADVLHQVLQAGNVCDGAVAEGFQLVVGGRALPDVTADDAGSVVGGEAGVRQRPGWGSTFHGAVGVLHAHGG